ncbi:recombinase family protein [Methylocystis sp. ATCC 49242]|uniref:recombinase family protein n=1 Tax=Methylocystis sp. ATCC 49242 TaxID=622637 RepID=UPI0001F885F8|nr:recombinase family protein [Methylocystis sp. ATCC 49242]
MSRIFAYCRVSTADQTVDNQIREIEAAGFKVEPHRIITETVSGGVQASKRNGFAKVQDRLEHGDVLVVTKLDRLGRNVIDVRQTVEALAVRGVRVYCLALGGVDLTSPAGKMTMGVIAAVAEFERDLLIERTQAGLVRARAEGKKPGRPPAFDENQREEIMRLLAAGMPVNQLAMKFNTVRRNIQRIKASLPQKGGGNVQV